MSRMWGERRYERPGYVSGSETSKAAADSLSPKVLGELHRTVYKHLRDSGGSTDEEGSVATGIEPNTYRPRRIELQDEGYVRDSGERRLTASTRKAAVWVVTDKGRPST